MSKHNDYILCDRCGRIVSIDNSGFWWKLYKKLTTGSYHDPQKHDVICDLCKAGKSNERIRK